MATVSTLRLPAHFLTTASYWNQRKNPYRNRVETGGYLVADPNTPDTVRFATGPGNDAEHEHAELLLSRDDVEAAVDAAGYTIVGDWHTHPAGSHTDPSPQDREAWTLELKASRDLDRWASVILLRDEKRWVGMSGWDTRWKQGAYRTEPATITPELTVARELAREMAWMVTRSSLVDQAAWINDPSKLHQDLAVLDLNTDLVRRMRMEETNERLKRLGMREMPLPPLPRREVEVPGETVIHGGPTIRRCYKTAITIR